MGWALEDRAGAHLRLIASDHSLILPSTFDCWHKGHSATFFGPAGGSTRLDYIAIPTCWQTGIVSSTVSDIDLLNGHFDHSGVEVRLELKVLPQSQMMRQRRASYDRSAARLSPETLSRILDTIPVIATQTDVDTHWNVVMKHCQRHLNWYFPKKKRVQRQIYFSARTWQILNDRKDTQKEINALERRESLLVLARCFTAWSRRTPEECAKRRLSFFGFELSKPNSSRRLARRISTNIGSTLTLASLRLFHLRK